MSTPSELAAVVREALERAFRENATNRKPLAALDALLALVEDYEKRPWDRLAAETVRDLERQLEEMRRERDEWESRYEELLSAVGGVWPT